MNIELRFLQKAIEDKNCICFYYNEKAYKTIQPKELKKQNDTFLLVTTKGVFEFEKIKKLTVLKERF
jgi:UDP-N-acetyl-D-mannosaminuronate dehydrogenase